VASQGRYYLVETADESKATDYTIDQLDLTMKLVQEVKNGGLSFKQLEKNMETIGRRLTEEGMNNVKKLDSNKDGKLDADEVDVKGDFVREDYTQTNIGNCCMCKIIDCAGEYHCSSYNGMVPRLPYLADELEGNSGSDNDIQAYVIGPTAVSLDATVEAEGEERSVSVVTEGNRGSADQETSTVVKEEGSGSTEQETSTVVKEEGSGSTEQETSTAVKGGDSGSTDEPSTAVTEGNSGSKDQETSTVVKEEGSESTDQETSTAVTEGESKSTDQQISTGANYVENPQLGFFFG